MKQYTPKIMRTKYIVVLALSMLSYKGYAQVSLSNTVIASTGNYSSSSNYNYSSTAGEAVIVTLSGSSMVLTQGFHQPLNSNSTTSVEQQYADANFSVLVYPNPTSNHISIEIETDKNVDLNIEVIDMLGKICGKVKQVNQFTGQSVYQCELSGYSSGLYFIKVSSKDELYNKTIRVQKID